SVQPKAPNLVLICYTINRKAKFKFNRSITMKIAVYSTKSYDRKYLELVNVKYNFDLEFFDFMLSKRTAKMAEGCQAVCIFVNDNADREVLTELAQIGVKIIALRCAGFKIGRASCRERVEVRVLCEGGKDKR